MSTDSSVVSPQFFPGGNIGRLAVCGTVNDVATSGANVRYLSCGFILEEGYPMDKLHQIVQTMAETAREAGVSIITGDNQGGRARRADGVYINTAGVGEVPEGGAQRRQLPAWRCHPGVGYTGRPRHRYHEPTQGLGVFEHHRKRRRAAQPPDCRCLPQHPTHAASATLTRGWLLASTLNEFAQASGVAMEIDEDDVPVRPDVQAACEMLGYDVRRWQTRARWSPWCRPSRPMPRWPPCAPPATARTPPSSVALPLAEGAVPPCAYAPAGDRPASSTCSWESSCQGFANDKDSGLLKIFRFQTCPARMPSIMGCVLQLKRQEHPWQRIIPM